jgi:tRNA (mo5U34)-methyltransferase
MLTRADAEAFLAQTEIPWHQRFQLAPGVYTPGVNSVARLFRLAQIPDDLSGKTVLDIGASNGGVSFEAERRGASRVVAVDVPPIEFCGFDQLRELLGSKAEWVQASVYELPELLAEQFDLVLFFGVLYHLRHPLLALDRIRPLVRGRLLIETAVCDFQLGVRSSGKPLVRFYRRDELNGDPSNWFAPTVRGLLDWCRSSGYEPELLADWPEPRLTRALLGGRASARCVVRATPTPGDPELSGESWAEWGMSVSSEPLGRERATKRPPR